MRNPPSSSRINTDDSKAKKALAIFAFNCGFMCTCASWWPHVLYVDLERWLCTSPQITVLCVCKMSSHVWPVGQYQIILNANLNHDNSNSGICCLQLPTPTYLQFMSSLFLCCDLNINVCCTNITTIFSVWACLLPLVIWVWAAAHVTHTLIRVYLNYIPVRLENCITLFYYTVVSLIHCFATWGTVRKV